MQEALFGRDRDQGLGLDDDDRLTQLVTEWSAACVADRAERPDAVRRPVRAIARAFPSAPVRP